MKNIHYIQIPPAFTREIGNFRIDSAIPLPIEVGEDFHPDNFSLEMILSAILQLMAYRRDHENIQYYRDFALAARPTLLAELSQAGLVRAQAQDFALAEEIFLAMEGLEPGNSKTALNLALLYEKKAEKHAEKEEWDAALENKVQAKAYYSKAKEGEPPLPEAWFNAGYFFLKEGSWEKAKENFEAYLEMGSDDEKREKARRALSEGTRQQKLDGLFKEAYDAILLGNETLGIEKSKEFLSVNPEVWNGWFLLGWAHRRRGEYTQGAEAFGKALELGGNLSDVLNELAVCSMELGDLKTARKHLETALASEPENTKIISNLGVLALKSGKIQEARGFFMTVLEFDPEDPLAKGYLERMNSQ